MRGLMPSAWTTPDTAPAYFREQLGTSKEDAACLSMYDGDKVHIYTDGSGGEKTSDPRLRSCGWAWVVNRYRWEASPSFVAHFGQRGTMREDGPEAQLCPELS